MIIVDSCGWLEWFTDGRLADQYKEYLAAAEDILMPAIILYEVYKMAELSLPSVFSLPLW